MDDMPRELRPDFVESETANLVELQILKERIAEVMDPKYVMSTGKFVCLSCFEKF
jgi:hypothetical protein